MSKTGKYFLTMYFVSQTHTHTHTLKINEITSNRGDRGLTGYPTSPNEASNTRNKLTETV